MTLDEKWAASCLVGSLTDLVKLQVAKALIESIETTNTGDELDQAAQLLFHACSALETEAEGEMRDVVREELADPKTAEGATTIGNESATGGENVE